MTSLLGGGNILLHFLPHTTYTITTCISSNERGGRCRANPRHFSWTEAELVTGGGGLGHLFGPRTRSYNIGALLRIGILCCCASTISRGATTGTTTTSIIRRGRGSTGSIGQPKVNLRSSNLLPLDLSSLPGLGGLGFPDLFPCPSLGLSPGLAGMIIVTRLMGVPLELLPLEAVAEEAVAAEAALVSKKASRSSNPVVGSVGIYRAEGCHLYCSTPVRRPLLLVAPALLVVAALLDAAADGPLVEASAAAAAAPVAGTEGGLPSPPAAPSISTNSNTTGATSASPVATGRRRRGGSTGRDGGGDCSGWGRGLLHFGVVIIV